MTYETLARKLDQCLAAQVKLQKERDMLLAACKATKERWDFIHATFPQRTWKHGDQQVYDAVSAAIAKCHA